jgi:hypothetical protein
MIISFFVQSEKGLIEWSTGEVVEHDGIWSVVSPRLMRSLTPSREYLVRNARLIAEDSLGLSPDEAQQMFAEHLDHSPGESDVR